MEMDKMNKMNKNTAFVPTVPADVPASARNEYVHNVQAATKGTGKLMLFAGDQKIEHLNDDYHGVSDLGPIPVEANNPEHLFRIASQGIIGVFATQYGLVARYGKSYPYINYVVKLNSKSHLVKTTQKDPVSTALVDVQHVVELKKNSGLNIVGVGYTIYVGSEFENDMLVEAGRIVAEAHQHGLLTIFWMYPRGKAVKDEKDPHLIAGAAGVACALGADFAKVNYPKKEGAAAEVVFREAVEAAGRTQVICAGGSSTDARSFLEQLWKQIHLSGAHGNATGRNIHQKPLAEAVRMCNAISAITLGGKEVDFAVQVYEGKETFRMV